MVRGDSSFPPFTRRLMKQSAYGIPRNSFGIVFAFMETVPCASLVRYRKEVLAVLLLLRRRFLNKEVNVLRKLSHECRPRVLP